tara:strand:- start:112 stop:276 length:165 start_codon:yes stop_codon:yes gene_type:complete
MNKEMIAFLASELEDIIERLRLVHVVTDGEPLHTDIICAQTALKHGLSMIKNKE